MNPNRIIESKTPEKMISKTKRAVALLAISALCIFGNGCTGENATENKQPVATSEKEIDTNANTNTTDKQNNDLSNSRYLSKDVEEYNKQFNSTEQNTTTNNQSQQNEISQPNKVSQEKAADHFVEMNKYKDLSVDEFEKLSQEQRLEYASFLADLTAEGGNYADAYGESKANHNCILTPVDVSPDNTGQEILDSNLFMLQIAYGQFDENPGMGKCFDINDGIKGLSGVYDDIGKDKIVTRAYLDTKDVMESMKKPLSLSDKYTALNTSDLLSKQLSNSETIKYKNIKFKDETGSELYARFVYVEYTKYDGSHSALWLKDRQTTTEAELDDRW